jgi:hypothetical protein
MSAARLVSHRIHVHGVVLERLLLGRLRLRAALCTRTHASSAPGLSQQQQQRSAAARDAPPGGAMPAMASMRAFQARASSS